MANFPVHRRGVTDRIPVEHRFFGLDKRTIAPALVVIGIALLWAVVLPLINRTVEYGQTTNAGDVFQLGPGLTFSAAPDWGVEKGLLTTDKTRVPGASGPVQLVNGGIVFTVTPGPFAGDVEEFLEQINRLRSGTESEEAFHLDSGTQNFDTLDGDRGLAETYTAINAQGIVGALVYDGTGVAITAVGPESELSSKSDQVGEMVESISYKAKPGRESR